MTELRNEAPAPETGYAPVNGLQMYYEVHGSGGTPLVLLHGGLFDIDQQFGEVLPTLAATRQVIAADFQAHGRTNDIDRGLTSAGLGVRRRRSPGAPAGGAGRRLRVQRRRRRRAAPGDPPSRAGPQGDRVVGVLQSRWRPPGEQGSRRVDHRRHDRGHADGSGVSRRSRRIRTGCRTCWTSSAHSTETPGWSDADIQGIAAPTLITVGDCDAVKLEHAVRFLQLRGGDVNGDFVGVPSSQLAVFPGSTHFFGMARTALVLDVVQTFLDAPMPEA